jgi:hypothetical protein
MALAHIGIAKVVHIAIGAVAAAAFALDPSYKMFAIAMLVAGTPPTITGLFSMRLQAKALKLQAQNAQTLHKVEEQTDGIFSRMSEKADQAQAKSDQQGVALRAATTRADSAEGRREGVESEQERRGDNK